MWNGSHVYDCRDDKSQSLQGTNSGIASHSRALYIYGDFLHTVAHSNLAGVLRDNLGCIRSALAGTAEIHLSSAGPADNIALLIGKRNLRIVESCVYMANAGVNIFAALGLADLYFTDFASLKVAC